jgi:hypothetical protein
MLHKFLTDNRHELVDRCKAKVLLRSAHGKLGTVQQHGIPQFLDQLIETLRIEQAPESAGGSAHVAASGGVNADLSVMGTTAGLHGRELLADGYSIHDVVHHYGDLCQAVTELAGERLLAIKVDEFHTLNRCLDNAIADAVRAHSEGQDAVLEDQAGVTTQRHDRFVRDLRSHLRTAKIAFSILKAGHVGPSGATGKVLESSLASLEMVMQQRDAEDLPTATGPPTPPIATTAAPTAR